jgi:hypothetical protein
MLTSCKENTLIGTAVTKLYCHMPASFDSIAVMLGSKLGQEGGYVD